MIENAQLRHALWLLMERDIGRYLLVNSHGRWDGAEKAMRHISLCTTYLSVALCCPSDQVRTFNEDSFQKVHKKTQELTDHMDQIIGFPLESMPDFDALAPRFFNEFVRLAMEAVGGSHAGPGPCAREVFLPLALASIGKTQGGADVWGADDVAEHAASKLIDYGWRPMTVPQPGFSVTYPGFDHYYFMFLAIESLDQFEKEFKAIPARFKHQITFKIGNETRECTVRQLWNFLSGDMELALDRILGEISVHGLIERSDWRIEKAQEAFDALRNGENNNG